MALHTLIVDDDPVVVYLIDRFLKRNAFYENPVSFENGQQALEYMNRYYNRHDYFIVFLDINMPVMDGWDFLESLKSFAHLDNTMIFIVTSSIDMSDQDRAAINPFVLKYIIKPVFSQTIDILMPMIVEKMSKGHSE